MKTKLIAALGSLMASGLVPIAQPVATPSPSPAMDSIAERYVKLVLAMGVQDPDYVDAYYGPPA
jgi:hypothetical protein